MFAPETPEYIVHKELAVNYFNSIWTILDKKTYTEGDKIEAIRLAHASTWHWSLVGTPLNQQRGEWICSRVYATFNMPESALFHAKKCLELTEKYDFKDFDLAYAYEATARAYSISTSKENTTVFYEKAKQAANQIEKLKTKIGF